MVPTILSDVSTPHSHCLPLCICCCFLRAHQAPLQGVPAPLPPSPLCTVHLPRSYLLDPVIRAALGLDTAGAIVIFDEVRAMGDCDSMRWWRMALCSFGALPARVHGSSTLPRAACWRCMGLPHRGA